MPPKLLCIVGPTASGKTRLAVELAKLYGGEVVSADSMQLYRGMDIGTAKPTAAEMDGVPHHMLSILDPSESYSAARYALDAARCVEDIRARGRLPIVAGGTGLYIDALTGAVQLPPEPSDPALRAALAARLGAEGPSALLERLRTVDPESAARLHENNTKRVIRALEVYELTGETMTERNRRAASAPRRYEPCLLGLCPAERSVLYRRIDRRVDDMLASGLPEEARRLWESGLLGPTARQAIGYKELFEYFGGSCTLSEAADRIRTDTRRYAKRQLTWFRRNPAVHWISYEEFVNFRLILSFSQEYLKSCAIL